MSVRVFYGLNGLEFDYDERVREILKDLATDEASVERDAVLSYLRNRTAPLEPEYDATVALWLARIDSRQSAENAFENEAADPSDYDDPASNGE